MQILVLV